MNIDQSIKKEASGVLGRIALFLVYYIGLILFGIGLFVVAGWITLLALNISDPLSISIRLIIFGIVALLAMWWFCLELGLYLIRPILVSPDTTDSILPEIYEVVVDTHSSFILHPLSLTSCRARSASTRILRLT